jgi:hypothetical protein
LYFINYQLKYFGVNFPKVSKTPLILVALAIKKIPLKI